MNENRLVLSLLEKNGKAFLAWINSAGETVATTAAAERAKTRKYMDSALAYKTNVIPLMEKLRRAVDEMEGIVPAEVWPLPSYGEMTMKQ